MEINGFILGKIPSQIIWYDDDIYSKDGAEFQSKIDSMVRAGWFVSDCKCACFYGVMNYHAKMRKEVYTYE